MRHIGLIIITLLLAAAASWSDETADSLLPRAQKGDQAAQYDLALHYLFAKRFTPEGKEYAPDYVQAAQWLKKAAKAGHAKAQYLLGSLYERGRGVKQDNNQAMAWYKKAVAGGDSDAACPLARLYEKSDIHPKDPEISRPCYMK